MAGTGGLLHASLQVAQAQFLPFGKTGNTPISPIANSQTVFSTVRILHSTYLESPSVEGLSYGRDRRIRTVGILLPKQALYQAELSPETVPADWKLPTLTHTIINKKYFCKQFFIGEEKCRKSGLCTSGRK